MSDHKPCEWCAHFRYKLYEAREGYIGAYCAIERPLIPCEQYEREVGADDDRGNDNG